MRAVTFFDGMQWREGVASVDEDGRMLVRPETPAPGLPRVDGVVVGGFTDHHVHLQLVDHTLLAGSRLGRVVDLGANVEVLAGLARRNSGESSRPSADRPETGPVPAGSPELWRPGVRIEYAGAFLTTPGGYPSDRAWAPEGSFRGISSAADAEAAVADMAGAGATRIKIVCNSTAGPVLGDDLFRAVVEAAARRDLPVVAHAEGPGQAQRVVRLGADVLAHSPFSERLTDDEIAEQAASVAWLSTLAIHADDDRERAIDNVRRFHAAGGTVLYGSDMGNGPTPVDLNAGEIAALREAGLDDRELLRALAPVDPLDPASVLLIIPGATPETADPLQARLLTRDDLEA